jgi:hypothetical protein
VEIRVKFICIDNASGGQTISRVVIIMNGESDLLEMVGACHPPCGFASGLDGGQQQSDEHADNGDDDEEFDEGESAPS